jgi:hypothetical protein
MLQPIGIHCNRITNRGARREDCEAPTLSVTRQLCDEAADYAGIQAGREREELLSHLVSVCIEELLRPDGHYDGASRTKAGVDRVSRCT